MDCSCASQRTQCVCMCVLISCFYVVFLIRLCPCHSYYDGLQLRPPEYVAVGIAPPPVVERLRHLASSQKLRRGRASSTYDRRPRLERALLWWRSRSDHRRVLGHVRCSIVLASEKQRWREGVVRLRAGMDFVYRQIVVSNIHSRGPFPQIELTQHSLAQLCKRARLSLCDVYM